MHGRLNKQWYPFKGQCPDKGNYLDLDRCQDRGVVVDGLRENFSLSRQVARQMGWLLALKYVLRAHFSCLAQSVRDGWCCCKQHGLVDV